jgi:hypothetical protein
VVKKLQQLGDKRVTGVGSDELVLHLIQKICTSIIGLASFYFCFCELGRGELLPGV